MTCMLLSNVSDHARSVGTACKQTDASTRTSGGFEQIAALFDENSNVRVRNMMLLSLAEAYTGPMRRVLADAAESRRQVSDHESAAAAAGSPGRREALT